MLIFYGLVQMIRWLLLLGFNSVCFYDTRNRPLFYSPLMRLDNSTTNASA